MARINRDTARSIASANHIDLKADFHQLDSAAVERVLIAADEYRYRKPMNANGSRARYFFEMLSRTARRAEA